MLITSFCRYKLAKNLSWASVSCPLPKWMVPQIRHGKQHRHESWFDHDWHRSHHFSWCSQVLTVVFLFLSISVFSIHIVKLVNKINVKLLNFGLSIIKTNGMLLYISVDAVQTERKAWYKNFAPWGPPHPPREVCQDAACHPPLRKCECSYAPTVDKYTNLHNTRVLLG